MNLCLHVSCPAPLNSAAIVHLNCSSLHGPGFHLYSILLPYDFSCHFSHILCTECFPFQICWWIVTFVGSELLPIVENSSVMSVSGFITLPVYPTFPQAVNGFALDALKNYFPFNHLVDNFIFLNAINNDSGVQSTQLSMSDLESLLLDPFEMNDLPQLQNVSERLCSISVICNGSVVKLIMQPLELQLDPSLYVTTVSSVPLGSIVVSRIEPFMRFSSSFSFIDLLHVRVP